MSLSKPETIRGSICSYIYKYIKHLLNVFLSIYVNKVIKIYQKIKNNVLSVVGNVNGIFLYANLAMFIKSF